MKIRIITVFLCALVFVFLFGCESQVVEKNGSDQNENTSESAIQDEKDSNSTDEAQNNNNTKQNDSHSSQSSASSETSSSSSGQNKSGNNNSSKQTGSSSGSSGNNSSTSSQNQQQDSGSQQQTSSGWKFSDINVSAAEQECLNYINKKRSEIGVVSLSTGTRINQIAGKRANEIVVNFTHQRKRDIYSENKYGMLKTVSDVPGWQNISWAYDIDENGNYYSPKSSNEAIGMVTFDYEWPYKDATELSKKVGIDIAMGFCGSPSHWAYIKDSKYTAGAVGITLIDNKDGTCTVYGAVLLIDKLYE